MQIGFPGQGVQGGKIGRMGRSLVNAYIMGRVSEREWAAGHRGGDQEDRTSWMMWRGWRGLKDEGSSSAVSNAAENSNKVLTEKCWGGSQPLGRIRMFCGSGRAGTWIGVSWDLIFLLGFTHSHLAALQFKSRMPSACFEPNVFSEGHHSFPRCLSTHQTLWFFRVERLISFSLGSYAEELFCPMKQSAPKSFFSMTALASSLLAVSLRV